MSPSISPNLSATVVPVEKRSGYSTLEVEINQYNGLLSANSLQKQLGTLHRSTADWAPPSPSADPAISRPRRENDRRRMKRDILKTSHRKPTMSLALAHSRPSRSRRSLPKVSANSGRRNISPRRKDNLVTVIVPAYNAARTLAAMLSSVRNQTHGALEILVIDGRIDGHNAGDHAPRGARRPAAAFDPAAE